MPRFYVRLVGDPDVVESADPFDYPDLDAVLAETVRSARLMLSENLAAGKLLGLDRRYEIYDEQGQLVHTITFHSLILSGD